MIEEEIGADNPVNVEVPRSTKASKGHQKKKQVGT